MRKLATPRTGRTGGAWLAAGLLLAGSALLTPGAGDSGPSVVAEARAAEPAKFTAQVDRARIGLDDTIALKLNVQAEGQASVSQPTFDAPDFEVLNSFSSSFVESSYDQATNRWGVKNSQQLTRILRPKKPGNLRISHLRVTVDGHPQTAPDIVVQVSASGSAGGPQGLTAPLGRVQPQSPSTQARGRHAAHAPVFVRAEVDKDKVYKGEQVVVSYYLYRRVRAMNLNVTQFPTLNGFLREELEMPVMQPRLESEPVVIDGIRYERSLLARYATYPLQEGRLKIDPLGLKYNYFGEADSGAEGGDEDPFMNFFRQMAPREGMASSDPVFVQVQPLPAEGRPAHFSGESAISTSPRRWISMTSARESRSPSRSRSRAKGTWLRSSSPRRAGRPRSSTTTPKPRSTPARARRARRSSRSC